MKKSFFVMMLKYRLHQSSSNLVSNKTNFLFIPSIYFLNEKIVLFYFFSFFKLLLHIYIQYPTIYLSIYIKYVFVMLFLALYFRSFHLFFFSLVLLVAYIEGKNVLYSFLEWMLLLHYIYIRYLILYNFYSYRCLTRK